MRLPRGRARDREAERAEPDRVSPELRERTEPRLSGCWRER